MRSNIVSTAPGIQMTTNLTETALVRAGLVPLSTTARSNYVANRYIDVTETVQIYGGAGYLSSTVSGLPTGSSARTVECMAYFTGLPTSNNGSIVHWGTSNVGQDWCLVPRGGEISGNIGGHFWSVNLDSGVSISTYGLNTWIHICLVYTGSSAQIYVNGELKNATTPSLNTGSSVVNIGRRSTTNEYTSGRFREVRIWNKALTAAQVAQVNNTRLEYIPSGLIFYSRLNTEPGASVDLAGGNTIASNGTITSDTMSYTVFSRRSSTIL